MARLLKYIDIFSKNIIIVFFGTAFVSALNLLYQLYLAHTLDPAYFASVNTLLSIFMLISSPLMTLQMAVAKYTAEFRANNQVQKISNLLSRLLKKIIVFAILSFFIFYYSSFYLMAKLKIESRFSGLILGALIAFAWLMPIFLGGLQGFELFKWSVFVAVIIAFLKLTFAFIFIYFGFYMGGPLGAFLAANLIGIAVSAFILRRYINFEAVNDGINLREIFLYLFPVAASSFCFIALISIDMILVKYFFTGHYSGVYSLAQMAGKIFLFLPGAISIVMFPRVSGLRAKNIDTASTLKRALFYGIILCATAALFYNLFPGLVLKILTGKAPAESVNLGRLFSVSMSLYALVYILITYFLSLKDLRFIKYLAIFAFAETLAIVFFHKSIFQVQLIVCISAATLLYIHLLLFKKALR